MNGYTDFSFTPSSPLFVFSCFLISNPLIKMLPRHHPQRYTSVPFPLWVGRKQLSYARIQVSWFHTQNNHLLKRPCSYIWGGRGSSPLLGAPLGAILPLYLHTQYPVSEGIEFSPPHPSFLDTHTVPMHVIVQEEGSNGTTDRMSLCCYARVQY